MSNYERPKIDRIRRSELSTPGHSEKMIAKAAQSDADMVFLDLEDAVAPSSKVGARKNICLLYTSPSPRDATLSRMPSSA